MNPIDAMLAAVVAQAPLPVAWRAARMTPSDLAAVAAIEQAACAFPWPRRHFETSLAAGHLGLVLHDGARAVAGYLMLMPVVDTMHVLNVAVAPIWQRRGLGGWLLRAALALARAHDLDSLLLEVRASNAAAIALYRQLGAVEIGRRQRYYPADDAMREDALVMRIAEGAHRVRAA